MTLLELKPSEEQVVDIVDKKIENHCPFADKINEASGEHLERIIDNRIAANTLIKDYNLFKYRIELLEPDVKQIKTDISEIKLELSKRKTI